MKETYCLTRNNNLIYGKILKQLLKRDIKLKILQTA